MRAAFALLLPAAVALPACDSTVLLAIDAKTDFAPGTDFTSVFTWLERGDMVIAERTIYARTEDTGFVDGVRVAELEGLPRGRLDIRVALMSGSTPVVQRTVALDLQRDYAVIVVLSRACASVRCPGPGDDPRWTTCNDGVCVDPRCGDDPSACREPPPPPPRDSGPAPVDAPPSACPSGSPCDDGNPCTYGDVCSAAGACAGTPVTCTSDPCVTRTCNGTSSCAVSYPGTDTFCDDGNPCTLNVCDGAGACVTVPINTDGHAPIAGDYVTRCCGNEIVNILSDQRHCGGCFIDCAGRGCVGLGFGIAVCNCPMSNAACRTNGGPSWTCWDNPSDSHGWLCNCQSDADCSYGQTCNDIPGTNFCSYP